MPYRHCSGCGRGFEQKTWQKECYCGSCGEALKTGLRRNEPLDIHPYPSRESEPGLNDLLDQLGECAEKHPFWFSAGAVAAGVGGIMLGPGLVTLGQGAMMIGGILASAGFLSVLYTEKSEAEKLISAGLLTLVAGAGIALVGYALTVAGVVAVVGGAGVATKATVEVLLRKRIERQLKEKSVTQLIGISRELS